MVGPLGHLRLKLLRSRTIWINYGSKFVAFSVAFVLNRRRYFVCSTQNLVLNRENNVQHLFSALNMQKYVVFRHVQQALNTFSACSTGYFGVEHFFLYSTPKFGVEQTNFVLFLVYYFRPPVSCRLHVCHHIHQHRQFHFHLHSLSHVYKFIVTYPWTSTINIFLLHCLLLQISEAV